MRITVNNTSMMQPMFESQQPIENDTVPMHRAYGLLEPASNEDVCEQSSVFQQPLFYPQSNTNNAPIVNVNWDDVLAIDAGVHCQRFVVFGFHFDGYDEWLRVWIQTQQRFLWITRPSNMTYRSYAAVTMKALSKIPPTWDGVLHPSPFQSEHGLPSIQHEPGMQAIVTDAAANEHGDLWFSVVLTPVCSRSADYSHRPNTNRGWIRASPEL